jgi:hypothetical protein
MYRSRLIKFIDSENTGVKGVGSQVREGGAVGGAAQGGEVASGKGYNQDMAAASGGSVV